MLKQREIESIGRCSVNGGDGIRGLTVYFGGGLGIQSLAASTYLSSLPPPIVSG